MIILKFTKTSTSALTAHVDTLRAMTYIFRRAKIDVEYSQGYNPHMELGFSPPLALGVESLCEYVSAKAQYQDGILEKLNAVCPQGISFVKVFRKQVNLASKITRATYKIEAAGIGCATKITAPDYCISYLEKGDVVTKNVASRIFGAQKIDDNSVYVTLALGNDNLRPDRLVWHLQNKYGLCGDYKITKVESFVGDVTTDEFLESLPNGE